MSAIRSFELPHKALRNVIAKCSLHLGSVTVANPPQLAALKKVADEMFALLNNHVHTENEHTLTLLESRVPGSSDHDLADHERLELIQNELQQRISQLKGNEDSDSMHLLYLDFSQYHSHYLEHIFIEETVTELLLQKHFTDDELIQQRNTIMGSMEFPMLLLWLKYAIPAQQEDQNVNLLTGFKMHAPKEAFDTVINVLRGELDAETYSSLLSRLT